VTVRHHYAALNRALFGWHGRHRRDLAFRRNRDPYAVLVAEVMLQQTQAARVEPAWQAFMARFPTVEVLAAATPADAIRAWAGLGYYGRAVRLHRAARVIVERHAGAIPRDPAELERLPGVGGYTARAVAATAFGTRVAALDTNVRRVVGRVFGADGRPASAGLAGLQPLADAWVPADRAADWTHAVMDLGATICRARDPACRDCPLRRLCASAYSVGSVAATRPAGSNVPRRFEVTRRWLRGRIVARLTGEADGAWVEIGGPLGAHPADSVEAALDELVRDGIVERNDRGDARLAQDAAGRTPRDARRVTDAA
jgi:A/G-specific adenine glycosylase